MLEDSFKTRMPFSQVLWTQFAITFETTLFLHVVALSLGPSEVSALPMLHALTGSDTVSFFRNHGKKSAWNVWNVFPELTPVLCALKASPEIITEESLAVLERFEVLLY